MIKNSKKIVNIIVFFVILSQYSIAAASDNKGFSYSKEDIPKIEPPLLDIRLVDPSLYDILTIDQWAFENNLEVLSEINKYKNAIDALERKFPNLNAQNGHLRLSGNLLTNMDLKTGKGVTLNPSKFRSVVAKSDGTFDVTDGEMPNGDVIKGDAVIYADSIFIKGDGTLTSKNFDVQGTNFKNTLVHLKQDETTVSGNALVEGNNFIGVVGARSDGKNWFDDTGTLTFTPDGPIFGLRSAYVLDPYEEAKARVGLMSTYAGYQGSGSASDKGPFPANDKLIGRGKQELSRLANEFLKGRLPNQFDEAGNSLFKDGYILLGTLEEAQIFKQTYALLQHTPILNQILTLVVAVQALMLKLTSQVLET
ncbi:hypothetical protein HY637_04225 [Candidatus Woesearchaeota archaeon]|nr:hypothetical protein [Candidatus Woesearchaeota archaeon]